MNPGELSKDQCPYGQADCETTRGGACACAMPAALTSKPLICDECGSAMGYVSVEEYRELQAEIERLRAIATNVESLQREVERLRAALDRIANPDVRDGYEWKAAVVAREALRGADEPIGG